MSLLNEIASSVVINSIVYRFSSSSKAAPLLVCSLFFQTAIHALASCKDEKGSLSKIISANLFSLITGANLHILIHECGHAIAARLLFKNANSQITIVPFIRGNTNFQSKELTVFGKCFGRNYSHALVAAAGPLTSLVVSSLAMCIGILSQKRFDTLSKYLIAYGRSDLFSHAAYALTAKISSNSRMSHDFYQLSKVGVSSVAIAITFAAIPIFIEFKCL